MLVPVEMIGDQSVGVFGIPLAPGDETSAPVAGVFSWSDGVVQDAAMFVDPATVRHGMLSIVSPDVPVRRDERLRLRGKIERANSAKTRVVRFAV